MASSSGSSYTPPRAFFRGSSAIRYDESASEPAALARWQQIRMADEVYAKYGTVELGLLRMVTTLGIPIIPPSQIATNQIRLGTELPPWTHQGHSLVVGPGEWLLGGRNLPVAVKRMRGRLTDGLDEADAISRARALSSYGAAMFELQFEVEIMGSLGRHHRNVTKLLGVSFDLTSPSTPPVLVVELADMRHPDLDVFFEKRRSEGCGVISPLTARCILSDVADGIAALHARSYVHADIKPSNVLLFCDDASPCGWVAKLGDFGFSGRVEWALGTRSSFPQNRPRGGTAEWDAPECCIPRPVQPADLAIRWTRTYPDEQPFDQPPRDVYSFGLLCAFVALDGVSPRKYTADLIQAKLEDALAGLVSAQLDLLGITVPEMAELLRDVEAVTSQCLLLDPDARLTDMSSVRALLSGPPIAPELIALPPREESFFETFPCTYDEFTHSGLEDAYLACPRPFRQRVVDSFARRKNHPLFPQFVPLRVWDALLRAQEDTD